MEKDDEEPRLKLVADNSSKQRQDHRSRQDFEFSKNLARIALRRLATNLLRIIAGAGEPLLLLRDIGEAHSTYADYLVKAQGCGFQVEDPINDLSLDDLFSRNIQESEPTTEDDWHRWAQPIHPREEHLNDKAEAKLELRRAVLRQVASVLNSGDKREPHLRAHGGNLDDIIENIFAIRAKLRESNLNWSVEPDPTRIAIAEEKIAEIRKEKWLQQMRSLPVHQIAGLRAVAAGSVEKTDSFTLDVLGSMKLLMRPKGEKKKSAWRLTEEGQQVLHIHNEPSVKN